MENSYFNFEINLQRLATVKIAGDLWNSPQIIKDIQNFANDVSAGKYGTVAVSKTWHDKHIDKNVVGLLKSIGVPAKLQRELELMIIFMGEKVGLWMATVMTELQDVNFLRRICWTGHGVVDESQTFQHWKKNLIFRDNIAKDSRNRLFYYFYACTYADVGVIQANLKDIAKIIESGLEIKIKDYNRFKVNSAMTILLCWYFSNRCKVEFEEFYSNVKNDTKYPTGAPQMFLYCIYHKFDKAAEYYYNKLKNEDKSQMVCGAILGSVDTWQMRLTHASDKGTLEGTDVLSQDTQRNRRTVVYLLKKLSKADRKDILPQVANLVYGMFFVNTPYLELCMPLLKEVWNNFPTADKLKVLEKTLVAFGCSYEYEYVRLRKDFHEQILEFVLSKLPKDSKIDYFRNNPRIFNLFQKSQFSTIRVIISDDDLKKVRYEILDISNHLGEYLKKGGNSKNIQTYMDELEFSSNERDKFLKFCKDPKFLEKLLYENVHAAEDVLKWQCSSNEEVTKRIKIMRENLDNVKKLCNYFINQDKYEFVEKYLKLLSDGKETELKKMIFEIFTTEYLRAKFLFLWADHRTENSVSKKNCTHLVKFYSKITSETVSVIKGKVLGEPEEFIKELINFGSVKTIKFHETFQFLSVSLDRIKEIKQKIKENIDWWVEWCPTVRQGQFLALNELINWISTEEEKKDIIKKHINTKKAAEIGLMMTFFVRGTSGKNKEPGKIFFLEWVRQHGDVKQIKGNMRKVAVWGKYQDYLKKAMQLLDLCLKEDEKTFLEKMCLM